MPIRINKFGGMAPRLDPEHLPDSGAQLALNCDLTSGALRPIHVPGDLSALWEEGDNGPQMKSGVPLADAMPIPKPAAPYGTPVDAINPFETTAWLSLHAFGFLSYVSEEPGFQGQHRTIILAPAGQTGGTLANAHIARRTDDTIEIRAFMTWFELSLNRGGPYFFRGPRYRFRWRNTTNDNPARVGPRFSTDYFSTPEFATPNDPPFPPHRIPLMDPDTNNVFAYMDCVDVIGPRLDQDYYIENYNNVFLALPATEQGVGYGCYLTFVFRMTYAEPRRRHFYYAQSYMRGVAGEEVEGPPSALSSRITVLPGQKLTLSLGALPEGWTAPTKRRIYRSDTGSDDFVLLDEIAAANTTYLDNRPRPRGDAIPPFGNAFRGIWENGLSEQTATAIMKDILVGSVLHPAHFGAVFRKYVEGELPSVENSNELRVSDRYRLHAWPNEYAIPFEEDIQALALAGSTILVFGDRKVWAATGNDPGHTSKYLLSDTTPLLRPESLTLLQGRIYWVTDDGIAASGGDGVRLISAPYFTREMWDMFNPESLVGMAGDNSLFFEGAALSGPPSPSHPWLKRIFYMILPGGGNPYEELKLRFDMGPDEQAAVSLYTHREADSYKWRSRVWRFPERTQWDFFRIAMEPEDDTDVTVRFILDGEPVEVEDIAAPGGYALPSAPPCRTLEVELEGKALVKGLEVFERRVLDIPPSGARFTAADTPCWQNLWVRFPERGRFSAGMLSMQREGPDPDFVPAGPPPLPQHGEPLSATVTFYPDGATALDPITVTSGIPFLLDPLTPKANLWRIEVDADERFLESLTLAARTPEPVEQEVMEMHGGGLSPWLTRRYEVAHPRHFSSMIVHAHDYGEDGLTLNLYPDGAEEPVQVMVEDAREISLLGAGIPLCRSLEFDFDGADHLVRQVYLWTDSPTPIGREPVIIPAGRRNRRFRFPETGRFRAVSLMAASGQYQVTISHYPLPGSPGDTNRQIILTAMKPGEVRNLSLTLTRSQEWWVDILNSEDDPEHPHDAVDALVLWPEQVTPIPDNPGHMQAQGDSTEGTQWRWREYRLDGPRILTSVWARVRGAVKMLLFSNGASTPSRTISIDASGEYPLASPLTDVTRLIVQFVKKSDDTDAEHLVDAWAVFGGAHEHAGGPVHRAGLPWRRFRVALPEADRWVAGRIVAPEKVRLTLRPLPLTEEAIYTVTADSPRMFLLPRAMQKSATWEVDAVAMNGDDELPDAHIESLVLLPAQVRQAGAGLHVLHGGMAPEWLTARWEFEENTWPSFLEVVADQYPLRARVYVDNSESETPDYELDIEDRNAVPFPTNPYGVPAIRCLQFHFVNQHGEEEDPIPMDHVVRQVRLGVDVTHPVGNGVRLKGLPFWRFLRLWFEMPGVFAAAQVSGRDYQDLKLVLYAEGLEVHRETVKDGKAFRLPRTLDRASLWTVDLEGESAQGVESLTLMPLIPVPIGEAVRDSETPGRIPEWMWAEYRSPEPARFRSIWVDATEALTLNLNDKSQEIATNELRVEQALTDAPDPSTAYEVYFTQNNEQADHLVRQLSLFAEQTIPVEPWGLVVRGGAAGMPWRNRTLRFPDTGHFRVARLVLDSGIASLKLGNWTSDPISNSEAFLLRKPDNSPLDNARDWALDLLHTGVVRELHLFAHLLRPFRDAIVLRRDSEPWTWLDRQFVADRRVEFTSARIVSDQYPVLLTLYREDVKVITEREVTSDQAFRLPKLPPSRQWGFSVEGAPDRNIHEVALAASMEGLRRA